jgi:hypothetical protein
VGDLVGDEEGKLDDDLVGDIVVGDKEGFKVGLHVGTGSTKF